MNIPEEYIPLKLFIEKHFSHLTIWEDIFKNIRVKQKDNMFLYNYSDVVIVPRNNPIICKCRGLVLRNNGEILNYPFDRFFNNFENTEKAKLDWNTALAQEKIDGSLINVFWTGEQWEITTRGSFYPNDNPTEDSIDYAEEFKRLFKSFNLLDKDKCYMFELISKNNRIITKYDWEFVALIGARNILTLKELSQEWLNDFTILIGAYRPKQVSVKNIEECKELFKDLRNDEEGLVIVDDHFNRIKLKQESYLKMNKIKYLKEEELFEYIKGNIELDAEFIHTFPEVEEKINNIMIKWEEYQKTLNVLYNKFKPLLDISRKDFALEAMKYPKFKSPLFAMVDAKLYKDFVGIDML